MNKTKVAVITQARTTSTRLPGKIMLPVNGKPLLEYHVERLKSPEWTLIVATTTNATDDVIIQFCKEHHISYHRGSEHNVLERFYQTSKNSGAEILVRVTSDCPLIDASLIKEGITAFVAASDKSAYISNFFPRTYARGFDFEIFSMESLEDAYINATDDFDKEHVTPYLWKNKSGKMKVMNVAQMTNNSHLRLCVDTSEDFILIKTLIEKYEANKMNFESIESLMNAHPELIAINSEVEQKKHCQ